LVLGMALYRDRPIAELVDKLDLALPDGRDLTVARSAVAQARARVGAEPMRWLFERRSRKWAHEAAGEDRRHGLVMAPPRARRTRPRTARMSAVSAPRAARAHIRRCAS
jgi:hypothetical protein